VEPHRAGRKRRVVLEWPPHRPSHFQDSTRLVHEHRSLDFGKPMPPIELDEGGQTEQHRYIGSHVLRAPEHRGDDLPAKPASAMRGSHDYAANAHHRNRLLLAKPHLGQDQSGRGDQLPVVIAHAHVAVLRPPIQTKARGAPRVLFIADELRILLPAQASEVDQVHGLIVRFGGSRYEVWRRLARLTSYEARSSPRLRSPYYLISVVVYAPQVKCPTINWTGPFTGCPPPGFVSQTPQSAFRTIPNAPPLTVW